MQWAAVAVGRCSPCFAVILGLDPRIEGRGVLDLADVAPTDSPRMTAGGAMGALGGVERARVGL